MASRLAQSAANAAKEGTGSKTRHFFLEVCRCIPFIHASMRLEEVISVRDMRAVVKEKFLQFKHVTDPRAIDLLIFKGREELEVYLTGHKQRHHALTEYLDPVIKARTAPPRSISAGSAFLDSFLNSNYATHTGK